MPRFSRRTRSRTACSPGNRPWDWDWPEPHHIPDPIEPFRLVMYGLIIEFPREGRFDLVLTADGEDIARHALEARQASR